MSNSNIDYLVNLVFFWLNAAHHRLTDVLCGLREEKFTHPCYRHVYMRFII